MEAILSILSRLAVIAAALGFAVTAQSIEYELEGTIQRVDDEAMSITVELEGSGDVVTYKIDEDTEINFRTSLHSGFDELRSGQEVTLRFDDEILREQWILLRYIQVS